MNFFQAAVLGAVQGLSEFLPISSSGHLVLVQRYFGITEGGLAFDVFLHFATLLAVTIYFRNDLLKVSKKFLVAVGIASIPAVVVGLLFEDYITSLWSSAAFLGFEFLITGLFNFATEYKLKNQKEVKTQVGNTDAFIIGLFQAFSILPAISRSGSTVFAGVFRNIDRKVAFRFSFIMSLPVIFGANLVQLSKVVSGGNFDIGLSALLVGGALSFITGMFSLKLLEIVMIKAKMNYFGVYCVALGLFIILEKSL